MLRGRSPSWGDCPSGRNGGQVLLFIVNAAGVERIDPPQAMAIAGFRELVTNPGLVLSPIFGTS